MGQLILTAPSSAYETNIQRTALVSKIEDINDLEEGASIVKVRATNQRGLVASTDKISLVKVRFQDGNEMEYLASELSYEGTPGSDAPYLSDYDICPPGKLNEIKS